MSGDTEATLHALGDKIRDARESLSLSQDDVAKRIGLTRASVANLEAGRQGLTITRLVMLSRALRLNLDDLAACVELPALPPPPHNVKVTRCFVAYCHDCDEMVCRSADRGKAEHFRQAHIDQHLAEDTPRGVDLRPAMQALAEGRIGPPPRMPTLRPESDYEMPQIDGAP